MLVKPGHRRARRATAPVLRFLRIAGGDTVPVQLVVDA
jgi:hypothetical protein